MVDDDDTMLNVIESMLTQRGYACVTACNFEDGIKAVKFNAFAYIIADIFMDGMGGIEGIRQVKQLDPFIPVMAVSGGWQGMSGEKAIEAARMVGADSGLAKPFDETSFDTAFEKLRGSSLT